MFPNCFIAKPTPIAKVSSSKNNILNDLSNGIVSEFASILDDSAIAYDNATKSIGISIAALLRLLDLLPVLLILI
jgi:hypothetical protein